MSAHKYAWARRVADGLLDVKTGTVTMNREVLELTLQRAYEMGERNALAPTPVKKTWRVVEEVEYLVDAATYEEAEQLFLADPNKYVTGVTERTITEDSIAGD